MRAPSSALASLILSRGWRVGRPQFSIGMLKPSADDEGLLHWPVLLFYPEAAMQHDTVQDFCEADTFG